MYFQKVNKLKSFLYSVLFVTSVCVSYVAIDRLHETPIRVSAGECSSASDCSCYAGAGCSGKSLGDSCHTCTCNFVGGEGYCNNRTGGHCDSFGTCSFGPTAVCGNGTKEGSEQCDRGSSNTNTPCTAGYGETCTYCTTSCTEITVTGPHCGDGTTQTANGEQCDDNNNNNSDGCSSTCQKEIWPTAKIEIYDPATGSSLSHSVPESRDNWGSYNLVRRGINNSDRLKLSVNGFAPFSYNMQTIKLYFRKISNNGVDIISDPTISNAECNADWIKTGNTSMWCEYKTTFTCSASTCASAPAFARWDANDYTSGYYEFVINATATDGTIVNSCTGNRYNDLGNPTLGQLTNNPLWYDCDPFNPSDLGNPLNPWTNDNERDSIQVHLEDFCGNEVIEGAEICDDGSDPIIGNGTGHGCAADCTLENGAWFRTYNGDIYSSEGIVQVVPDDVPLDPVFSTYMCYDSYGIFTVGLGCFNDSMTGDEPSSIFYMDLDLSDSVTSPVETKTNEEFAELQSNFSGFTNGQIFNNNGISATFYNTTDDMPVMPDRIEDNRIIYLTNDLEISENIRYSDSCANQRSCSLLIVVDGNVTITEDVEYIDAFIIASGKIIVESGY